MVVALDSSKLSLILAAALPVGVAILKLELG